jgi:hypothetical protein
MFFKRAKEQHHKSNGEGEMQSTIPKTRSMHSKPKGVLEAIDSAICDLKKDSIKKDLESLGYTAEEVETHLRGYRKCVVNSSKETGKRSLTHSNRSKRMSDPEDELVKSLQNDIENHFNTASDGTCALATEYAMSYGVAQALEGIEEYKRIVLENDDMNFWHESSINVCDGLTNYINRQFTGR